MSSLFDLTKVKERLGVLQKEGQELMVLNQVPDKALLAIIEPIKTLLEALENFKAEEPGPDWARYEYLTPYFNEYMGLMFPTWASRKRADEFYIELETIWNQSLQAYLEKGQDRPCQVETMTLEIHGKDGRRFTRCHKIERLSEFDLSPFLTKDEFLQAIKFGSLQLANGREDDLWAFLLRNQEIIARSLPNMIFSQRIHHSPMITFLNNRTYEHKVLHEMSNHDYALYTFHIDMISMDHTHKDRCSCGWQSLGECLRKETMAKVPSA